MIDASSVLRSQRMSVQQQPTASAAHDNQTTHMFLRTLAWEHLLQLDGGEESVLCSADALRRLSVGASAWRNSWAAAF